MYKTSRKSANLSIEESAFRLHIAPRTLCKYEAGETVPGPEVVLAMSREYGKPEMTLTYCRENCAIGRAYGYEVLNGVDTSLVTVLGYPRQVIAMGRELLAIGGTRVLDKTLTFVVPVDKTAQVREIVVRYTGVGRVAI